jgi:hypothetical protein
MLQTRPSTAEPLKKRAGLRKVWDYRNLKKGCFWAESTLVKSRNHLTQTKKTRYELPISSAPSIKIKVVDKNRRKVPEIKIERVKASFYLTPLETILCP